MKDSLIPQAMKDAPRWGAWRTEERGGKPTKVPISAVSGRRAASNNLNDWTTFDAAVAYLKAHPDLNGRGFCLGDGWAGVDLDGCRDKTTGDIQQQAWKIINYLNSYTEVSPSGTGVKVFVRGNLPAAKGLKVEEIFGTGDHTGIEMYDSGRYFAVTGQWLEGTPQTVEKRTSKLAKLHTEFEQRRLDDTIIKKARNAKNADKFSRLFVDGDTSEHGDDDSSADLALCSLLAFYTRDRDQLDRLFRRSALYREKWEREDYRQRTIDKALTRGNDLVFEDAGGDDDNTDDDAQPIEVGDTAEPAALTWAIDDVEPDDHLTGYYSEEGAAKSLLASYRAFCYASGVQYLGHAVKKRGNVLYLDWEKGQADFERNIWAIARGFKRMAPPSGIFYRKMKKPIRNKGVLTTIRRWAEKLGVVTVIIDSASVAGVMDAGAAIEVYNGLQSIAEDLHITISIIDHQARVPAGANFANQMPYGTRFKEALVSQLWQVDKGPEEPNKLDLVLRDQKHSHGPEKKPIGVRIRYGKAITFEAIDPESEPLLAAKLKVPDRILSCLKEHGDLTSAEIVGFTGINSLKTVKSTMSRLSRAHKVVMVDKDGQTAKWRAVTQAEDIEEIQLTKGS